MIDIDTQEEFRKLCDLERSWQDDTAKVPPENADFNIHVSLKRGGVHVAGILFDLLTQIGKTGNVRRACEETGIARDKAWTLLSDAQAVLGKPVVCLSGTGLNDSECALTDEGLRFVRSYDAFSGNIDKHASDVFEEFFGWIGTPSHNK